MTIPTAIVASAHPSAESPRTIRRQFQERLEQGARLICAGDASADPAALLAGGHGPKNKVSLFGTDFFLSHPRQNPDLRFFVGYVAPPDSDNIYCRIFYKDISLIWRVATHLFLEGNEMWIGKGDTVLVERDGWDYEESNESTTDLPLEIQSALEHLNRSRPVRQSLAALPMVLRRAPRNRIRAYEDFLAPRRRAASNQRNLIHRGRPIVWFERADDPSSLRIAEGFEPDFEDGVVEVSLHESKFYGGEIHRHRVLCVNRKVQHLFLCSPRHVWMIPPQALTTELSSYGVRTIDVAVDEDAYVPGYEYHFREDDNGEDNPDGQLHSQIPEGFAGEPSPVDDTRVDASAWLDLLPILQLFRQYLAAR